MRSVAVFLAIVLLFVGGVVIGRMTATTTPDSPSAQDNVVRHCEERFIENFEREYYPQDYSGGPVRYCNE